MDMGGGRESHDITHVVRFGRVSAPSHGMGATLSITLIIGVPPPNSQLALLHPQMPLTNANETPRFSTTSSSCVLCLHESQCVMDVGGGRESHDITHVERFERVRATSHGMGATLNPNPYHWCAAP